MIKAITTSLTCGDCGTGLDLKYTIVDKEPAKQPALGCPECLYTQDVEDAVALIASKNEGKFVRVLSLQPHTEIGIGASLEHR